MRRSPPEIESGKSHRSFSILRRIFGFRVGAAEEAAFKFNEHPTPLQASIFDFRFSTFRFLNLILDSPLRLSNHS